LSSRFARRSIRNITIGQRQIAFARDVRFPDRLRVSVGGFGMTNLYGVAPGSPDLAQLVDAGHLRLEVVNERIATAASFTGQARTYIR